MKQRYTKLRTKYTRDMCKRICSLIAGGNYITRACEAVGIHPDTHYEWMKKHTDYAEEIKKAEALSELWHVDNIKKASARSWQASAWYLERRYPERWGRQIILQNNESKLDKLIDGFRKAISE